MKLHYKISFLLKLFRKKKAIFLGTAAVATISFVLIYAALSDYNARSLVRALLPMPQIAARFHCAFQQKAIPPLPAYEFLISATDFDSIKNNPLKKLVHDPSRGKLDLQSYATTQEKSFARVTVRFQSSETSVNNIGSARIRRRGSRQPAPVLPFSFKMVFADKSISGFKESHLQKMGWNVGKPAFWWPFHMWLANKLKLIAPRNRLVRIKVNGEDWGVFWEFEHWGKETFDQYSINNAEIYGETDDHPFLVERYLWKNVEAWKKYYPSIGQEDIDQNFAHLHDLIDFLNNSDQQTFDRKIFNYVDFKSVVGWAVHMAVMDSYHQLGWRNARLLFNMDTKKFETIPWDALPAPGLYPRLKKSIIKTYNSHILLMRLFNNEQFFRAYTNQLYKVSGELKNDAENIFSDIYMRDNVFCPMVENPYAGRILTRNNFSLSGIKNMLWHGPWKQTVNNMRSHIVETANTNRAILASQLLFVSRNLSGGTALEVLNSSDGDKAVAPLLILGHRGQSATVLQSIILPLSSTAFDGQEVRLKIKLRPKPTSRTLWLPYRNNDMPPKEHTLRSITKVKNGRLVVEGLNFTLIPNFPKLLSSSLDGSLTPIHSQEYELFLGMANKLPINYAGVTLNAVNSANGKPIKPIYKNFKTSVKREQSR